MGSRLIRDDLLESDRWLGLTHDAERLAFVVVLLKADDLGNLEATDGGLVRMWRNAVSSVTGVAAALRLLEALIDVDLVRTYEHEGKRYLHVPRFQQRLKQMRNRVPMSPWNTEEESDKIRSNAEARKKYLGKSTTTPPNVAPHERHIGATVAPLRRHEPEPEPEPEGSVKANAFTAAEPAATPPPKSRKPADPEKIELWQVGRDMLAKQGLNTEAAGSFLGKVVKLYGQKRVLELLRQAQAFPPAELKAWLVAACEERGKSTSKQAQLESRNKQVADAWVPPELRQERA